MRLNQIISFIGALIVSSLLVGLVAICFGLAIFDLAGGESLSQVENQTIAALIVAVLLLIIFVSYAKRYIRKGEKPAAYGIMAAPLAAVIIITFYFFTHNVYNTKFDKTVWEQSEWKPEKMAKTFVRQKALIGLTKAQVKAMLGKDFNEYGDVDSGSLIYRVQNDWTLIVFFQKGKVSSIELRQPYLGV